MRTEIPPSVLIQHSREEKEIEIPTRTFDSIGIVGATGQTGRLYIERVALGSPALHITAIDLVDPSQREITFPEKVSFTNDLASVLNPENEDQKNNMPEAFILATTNPADKLLETFRDNIGDRHVTLILPQNGIDVVPTAQRILAGKNVTLIRASLFTPVEGQEDGKIKYPEDKLRMGLSLVKVKDEEPDPQKEQELKKTINMFRAGRFDVRKFENYQSMEWTKLVLNAIGITGGVTGLTPEEVFGDHDLYLLEMQALHDRLTILDAAGIKLEHIPWGGASLLPLLDALPAELKDLFQRTVKDRVTSGRGNKLSSVAIGVANGIRTEAHYYLNPFIELGEKYGLYSPVDQAILELLDKNDKGDIDLRKKALPATKKKLLIKTVERIKNSLGKVEFDDPHLNVIYPMLKREIKAPENIPSLPAATARLVGEFLLRGANMEIVDPNGYLEIAQEHLRKGPLLEVFNHFPGDVFAWGEFQRENVAPLDDLGVLIARKYTDASNFPLGTVSSPAFYTIGEAFGTTFISLVQSKDREKYEKDADSFNRTALDKAIDFLEPGKALGAMIEGTRSRNGQLKRAEDGISIILKRKPDTLILPVVSIPIPFRRYGKEPTKIFVCEPVTLQQLEEERKLYSKYYNDWVTLGGKEKLTISDCLMARMAAELPIEHQGPYKSLVILRRELLERAVNQAPPLNS